MSGAGAVAQAFEAASSRLKAIEKAETNRREIRARKAHEHLSAILAAHDDLRSFWLPKINKALESGKLSVSNGPHFGHVNCNRPYREELEKLLGPPFRVIFQVGPYFKLCYCEVVW